jgi:hypothetical protein
VTQHLDIPLKSITYPSSDSVRDGYFTGRARAVKAVWGQRGGDGSLCIAMLDAMMHLFGDVDYTDP